MDNSLVTVIQLVLTIHNPITFVKNYVRMNAYYIAVLLTKANESKVNYVRTQRRIFAIEGNVIPLKRRIR